MMAMANGGHTILHREVDPPAILRDIARHGVTHALFVPAVLNLLLATPGVEETDVSTLTTIVYGASPISDEVLVRALDTFRCDFIQAYGLTETTGAVTILSAEDHDPSDPDLLRSCGRPMPGAELRIVDAETGADLPDGAVGEVWIRSPQVMLGYFGRPEETAAAKTPDGWLRTGDAGFLRDGYLYLHDRVKDMIVSGGENVYPTEVENVLMAHPAVADVAVIGVPHDRWGETVKAVVVADPGVEVLGADLIAFARAELAHYKCPTSVDFVESLPRNPSGKVLKRELREPYWEGRDRRIGG
jgi:long-chain acyl-CoA synthetase